MPIEHPTYFQITQLNLNGLVEIFNKNDLLDEHQATSQEKSNKDVYKEA